ncbi:MAG TPA: squalene synthase HpnC [Hydrogenophaga sp.]|nr:squalene synthase HpnC [Hydrogenophaga sp.]
MEHTTDTAAAPLLMNSPPPSQAVVVVPATPTTPLTQGVGHYENFPVASLLCPARLRPAVMAIYHFARTADDIADEGPADASVRLAELARYREALNVCALQMRDTQPCATQDSPPGEVTAAPLPALLSQWPAVFGPLGVALREHRLPLQLLHDLISAFEQDVRYTASAHRYANIDELLDYTRLSAQPVGRLLLHLYGVSDETSLKESDQICSALQLINFWQDISIDLARQRCYLPADVLARHGARVTDFLPDAPLPDHAARAVIGELCAHARGLMMQGAPLASRIPGRAGWELRLVVQGGLRILDGIAAIDHRSWLIRPRLQRADLPRLFWRSLWM